MFSQECFEASFEIDAPKTLENIQQNVCSGVSLKLRDYSLQPTTGPKTLPLITFLEVIRNHCKTVPFSL